MDEGGEGIVSGDEEEVGWRWEDEGWVVVCVVEEEERWCSLPSWRAERRRGERAYHSGGD
jgi:hypothetical protein